MYLVKMFWSFAVLWGTALNAEAKAIQIKIVLPVQTTVRGECSPSIRIQMMNETGAVEKVNKAIAVDLKTPVKDLTFFGDAKCIKKLTSVEIPAGENSTVFYFKTKSTGEKTIIVSSQGYLGDVSALTVL